MIHDGSLRRPTTEKAVQHQQQQHKQHAQQPQQRRQRHDHAGRSRGDQLLMRWGPLCGRNLRCLESQLAKTTTITTSASNHNNHNNHNKSNNTMTMSEGHGRHVHRACGSRTHNLASMHARKETTTTTKTKKVTFLFSSTGA